MFVCFKEKFLIFRFEDMSVDIEVPDEDDRSEEIYDMVVRGVDEHGNYSEEKFRELLGDFHYKHPEMDKDEFIGELRGVLQKKFSMTELDSDQVSSKLRDLVDDVYLEGSEVDSYYDEKKDFYDQFEGESFDHRGIEVAESSEVKENLDDFDDLSSPEPSVYESGYEKFLSDEGALKVAENLRRDIDGCMLRFYEGLALVEEDMAQYYQSLKDKHGAFLPQDVEDEFKAEKIRRREIVLQEQLRSQYGDGVGALLNYWGNTEGVDTSLKLDIDGNVVGYRYAGFDFPEVMQMAEDFYPLLKDYRDVTKGRKIGEIYYEDFELVKNIDEFMSSLDLEIRYSVDRGDYVRAVALSNLARCFNAMLLSVDLTYTNLLRLFAYKENLNQGLITKEDFLDKSLVLLESCVDNDMSNALSFLYENKIMPYLEDTSIPVDKRISRLVGSISGWDESTLAILRETGSNNKDLFVMFKGIFELILYVK